MSDGALREGVDEPALVVVSLDVLLSAEAVTTPEVIIVADNLTFINGIEEEELPVPVASLSKELRLPDGTRVHEVGDDLAVLHQHQPGVLERACKEGVLDELLHILAGVTVSDGELPDLQEREDAILLVESDGVNFLDESKVGEDSR